jgi:formate dehydrogenase subunit gamma
MDPMVSSGIEAAAYSQYRIPQTILWAFPALAAIACAAHAARRAFRHPRPSHQREVPNGNQETGSQETGSLEAVLLRYTLGQRLFHWTNAIACLGLLVSGLAIHSPNSFAYGFSTATWFAWHRFLGILLVLGILYHVLWDLYIRDAGFFMVIDTVSMKNLKAITMNFLGLREGYPRHDRYNPFQILAHWAIALSVMGLVVTGFILWKPTRTLMPLNVLGLELEFVFLCRTFHGLFSGILLALVIGHFYFAVLIRKNWVLSKAMLTGKVKLNHYLNEHRVRGKLVSLKGSQE